MKSRIALFFLFHISTTIIFLKKEEENLQMKWLFLYLKVF